MTDQYPNPQDTGQPNPQQMYPQQPYPQQMYPQPYPPPGCAPYGYGAPLPRNNSLAVVSLVAGILGLTFLPLIGSIVAVITGHLARKQIQLTREAGDGMALFGLIVGWIVIGIGLVGVIIFVLVLLFASAAFQAA